VHAGNCAARAAGGRSALKRSVPAITTGAASRHNPSAASTGVLHDLNRNLCINATILGTRSATTAA
jgi:hypothetical protein